MYKCYYDKLKKDEFEALFSNTYIGKNPTKLRNSYHILRFNFSRISTNTIEETIDGFRREVASSIKVFVERYGLDFYINEEDTAEGILDNLFKAFYIQKSKERIYVIIDEYDHFANELLGFKTEEFNDMLGFSKEDVKYLMEALDIDKKVQEQLMPIIKTNYDGYVFSSEIDSEEIEKYKMYNPNMTLFFLNEYTRFNKVPMQLTDINIISDYSKIEAFMDLCKNMNKIEILEKIVLGEAVESELTEKFNAEIEFGEKELISLLYYLGYLTIVDKGYSKSKFKIPNDVIRKIYSEYFLTYISKKAEILTDNIDTEGIKMIPKIRCYSVVAIKDELYVEEN